MDQRYVYLTYWMSDPIKYPYLLRVDLEKLELKKYAGHGEWVDSDNHTYADYVFQEHMSGFGKVSEDEAKDIMEAYDKKRA